MSVHKSILLAFSAIILCNSSRAQQNSFVVETKLESPVWKNIKIDPIVDLGEHFTQKSDLFFFDEAGFFNLLVLGLTDVLNNIPRGVSINSSGDILILNIFITSTKSTTDLGYGSAQYFKNSKFYARNGDAYSAISVGLDPESGKAQRIGTVYIFMDQVLKKFAQVEFKTATRAEGVSKLLQYYETVLAHEIYGNIRNLFNTPLAQAQSVQDDTKTETIAYQAGISYLRDIHENKDRTFDIVDIVTKLVPENNLTTDVVCKINKAIKDYEVKAKDTW